MDLDNGDVLEGETNEEAPMETDNAPEPTETIKKPMNLTCEMYKMSF